VYVSKDPDPDLDPYQNGNTASKKYISIKKYKEIYTLNIEIEEKYDEEGVRTERSQCIGV
jgi:hypothetical protein